MIIRKYKKTDYLQLSNLLKVIFESDIDQSSLEQYYTKNNKTILIALDEQENQVIGFAFIEERFDYIKAKRVLFLSYLGVDEKYRNKGVGKNLISAIEKICKEQKYDAIELTSANYRTDSHAFYKNIGFTVKKTTVFIKEIDSIKCVEWIIRIMPILGGKNDW